MKFLILSALLLVHPTGDGDDYEPKWISDPVWPEN